MSQAKKTLIILVGIITVIAVGFVLQQLAFVLPHLILAIFLGNIFSPLIDRMRKYGVPMPIIIILILLIVAAALTGISYALYLGIDSVVQNAPKYQDRLNELMTSVNGFIQHSSEKLYGKSVDFNWKEMVNLERISGIAYIVAGSFLSMLGDLVLVLLFLVFVLAEARIFRVKIQKAFTNDHALRTLTVVNRIDKEVRQYILSKLLINTINGVSNAVIMFSFGVDFALLSAVLAFLLNFIPNIGTFISLGFPILVVLLQFTSLPMIILIIGLLVLVEFAIGNVFEPRIMGHSLNLSPLIVLFSLIFWGWLWGGWGMIMAVPITSVLKIVMQNIEPLRPIALLMSETPRLTKQEKAATA